MKRLLSTLIVLAVLQAAVVQAAIAIVGSARTNSVRPGTSVAVSSFTPSAGSLIAACLMIEFEGSASATYGMSDAVNGTYTNFGTQVIAGNQFLVKHFYVANAAASAITPTATSSASAYMHLAVMEFSGAATSSVEDGTPVGNTATSTTGVSGNLSHAAGSLLLTSTVTSATAAVTTNYGTQVYNAAPTSDVACAYAIEASAGSHQGDWTYGVNSAYAALISGFKVAGGGGGGGTVPRGTLLGVLP